MWSLREKSSVLAAESTAPGFPPHTVRLPPSPNARSLGALHGVLRRKLSPPVSPGFDSTSQTHWWKRTLAPLPCINRPRLSRSQVTPSVTVKSAGGSGQFVEDSVITEVTDKPSHRKSSPQRAPKLMA